MRTQSTSGLLLCALLASTVIAQTPDSLSSKGHCKSNVDVRWVTFGEIGDTLALIAALRDAADTGEAITYVGVEYGQDGRARKVHATGARSHAAGKDLESEFRAHLSKFDSLPKHFSIMVARLNVTDHVALIPTLVTCPPERGTTPKSDSILYEIDRLYSAGTVDPLKLPLETTLTATWLDESGKILAAWIERSSGDYFLDKKALDVVQAIHFSPPLIGSRTAPAILFMPVQFRLSGTTRRAYDPIRNSNPPK